MNATGVSGAGTAAALLAVLITTGCQSEPRPAALGVPVTLQHLPADEIMSLVVKDMRAEPILNMDLQFHDKDVKYDLSVRLDRQANCHVRAKVDDDSVEVTIVDRRQYVRFSPKTLRRELGQSETADALYAKASGKWILLGTPNEDMASLCDRGQIMDEFEAELGKDDIEVGDTTSYGGGKVVQLRSGDDAFYVSAEAPRLVSYSEDSEGTVLRFSTYDIRPVTKPGDDFVVTIPGFSPELLPA